MDNLIATYQHRLGLDDATFSRIDHDDAIVAVVYKITQPSSAPLILKICPRAEDFLREVYFLNYFAGSLPVPRVVQTVAPEAGIEGAVLMKCLPGSVLKVQDLADQLAYEIGSLLARIHLNPVAGYGELIHPKELSNDPRINFAKKFDEGLRECGNLLPQKLLEQCRDYFDTHLKFLASVDGPCIIHRDFRAGNVMVHDGKLQGIIDWSAARASFAQEDFCLLEHGDWSTSPVSKESFLAGYASIRPVPDYSAMMPLLRLHKAIATIGFTIKRGTWENRSAQLYQFNLRYLEELF